MKSNFKTSVQLVFAYQVLETRLLFIYNKGEGDTSF